MLYRIQLKAHSFELLITSHVNIYAFFLAD